MNNYPERLTLIFPIKTKYDVSDENPDESNHAPLNCNHSSTKQLVVIKDYVLSSPSNYLNL